MLAVKKFKFPHDTKFVLNNNVIIIFSIILNTISAATGEISNIPNGGIIFLKNFKYGSQIASRNSTIKLFFYLWYPRS